MRNFVIVGVRFCRGKGEEQIKSVCRIALTPEETFRPIGFLVHRVRSTFRGL